MGLKKNDNKPRTGTQKPEFKFNLSTVSNALRNDTFLFVSGAVITIIAIFFIIAYISFLFNGGTDQSAIANGVAQEIENSTGLLGARVSDNFVNRWFGIPSILIPVFLTVKLFEGVQIEVIDAGVRYLMAEKTYYYGLSLKRAHEHRKTAQAALVALCHFLLQECHESQVRRCAVQYLPHNKLNFPLSFHTTAKITYKR